MSKNKSKDKDKAKDTASAPNTSLARKQLIDFLNEDLSREYQAIIATSTTLRSSRARST